jgi:hypothetical protein
MNKKNKFIFKFLFIHTHIFVFLFFLLFLFFYFFIFWAGPSAAHMGWAKPSQPGLATDPSQWPGWAKQVN